MRPGLRVLVTRPGADGKRWCEELRRAGAEPRHFPCVSTEARPAGELRPLLRELAESAPWWWFTSRRGVEAVAAAIELPDRRYAVVGESTAHRLREAGREPALVGRGGAEALAQEWLRRHAGEGPVVLLGADRAGDEARRCLAAAGVELRHETVYRTLPRREAEPETLDVDAVLVASPSAVEGLVGSARLERDVPFVSIGPKTSRAVEAAGLCLLGEARQPTIDSMLEVLR